MMRDSVAIVWTGLVAATALTWWLGVGHGLGAGDAAMSLVLAIAFLKTWLVGEWFMELRSAPRALRLLFSGWVVVSCSGLLVLYNAA